MDAPGGAVVYVEAPVIDPPITTATESVRQFPTLNLHIGDARPHIRGKICEYLPL